MIIFLDLMKLFAAATKMMRPDLPIEKLSLEDIGLIDLADYWWVGLVAFTIATTRPLGSIRPLPEFSQIPVKEFF